MGTPTKQLRNVVLLGHSGSGKTTLIETMLYEGGEIGRRGRIESHNTVSDHTDMEREREATLFSHQMLVHWRENKINLIDTPGFDDFVGEVIAALKVADTALVLLHAAEGVEVGTELVWEYIEKQGTPALFVMNQMDHPKADYDQTLQQAKDRFGSKVVPIQYPLKSAEGDFQIVDALRMVVYAFGKEGGKPEKKPIPQEDLERASAMHNALVEIAAENEEGLMEKYFEKGTLSEEELAEGLTLALAQQQFFPLFIASGLNDMGSGRVMGFINDIAPSPSQRPSRKTIEGEEIAFDPKDKTTLYVYKTSSEPQVGQLTYFKVISGKVRVGDELVNADSGEVERFTQLFEARGKERIPVDELLAGDLGVSVKLKSVRTSTTLNSKGVQRKIRPMEYPENTIRKAVYTKNSTDTEKLFAALNKMKEEDPTLKVEIDPDTREAVLGGQGQLHIDLVRDRISKEHGVEMEMKDPKISYRETITGRANAEYRHKKQSGGAGQFAEIHITLENYVDGMEEPKGVNIRQKEIESLPWGGVFAFYWCIVGGAIDSRYIGAIKKGILSELSTGPLTGSPCQNVRVCVYDGKMHSVDSNDISFQLAAAGAFRAAFQMAGPQLLEPIYEVEVLCPTQATGEVMGDLQTRRAVVLGMDSENHYQKVTALVPLAQLNDYGSSLRSLSGGKAKFKMKFSSYQLVPTHIQNELVKSHSKESAVAP